MLERIASEENVDLPEDVKTLIATYSDRSFRDAAKLLEELVMQQKLTLSEAESYLGIRAKEDLLTIMNTKNLSEALSWIEEFSENGGNIKRTMEDMLHKLKAQLLLKNNVISDAVDIGYSIPEITSLMKLLHEAYNALRISPIETLPLEIAVVEFYNQRKKK
jgi:DNA polymerase-3 subunit gamma/tau